MELIRAQGKTSLASADVVIFTCDSTEIYIYIHTYIYIYMYMFKVAGNMLFVGCRDQ